MKNFLILVLFLCTGFNRTKAENTDITSFDDIMYIDPITIDLADDYDNIYISIKMKNKESIQGFSFDLYLPDCFHFPYKKGTDVDLNCKRNGDVVFAEKLMKRQER